MQYKFPDRKLEKVSRWYRSTKGLNAFMIFCLFQEFKKYIKEPILEVGPADGYMTQLILKNLNPTQYDVIEASKNYSAMLRKKFKSINVINSQVENLHIKKKYKTTIASHVLEHVKNVDEFLISIEKLLEKDGKLLVSVPNAMSFHRLLGVEMGIIKDPHQLNDQDRKIGHFRVYDAELLKMDLENNNFKINLLSGSFLKFLSNSQIERLINKKQWIYFYYLGKKFPFYCADLFTICEKKTSSSRK